MGGSRDGSYAKRDEGWKAASARFAELPIGENRIMRSQDFESEDRKKKGIVFRSGLLFQTEKLPNVYLWYMCVEVTLLTLEVTTYTLISRV
jgi:hypothetical protein